MEAQVYNQKGKSVGPITLPEQVFGLSWNADLVHQTVVAMQANARTPVAHTKTRGEVRGGGRKPWKQKGTGKARHGSTRSPIWVGGGVTHGPRNDKNYSQKVNKKASAKALCTLLSEKLRKGQILFVDEITFSKIKTKDAVTTLENLSKIKGFERLVGGKKVNTLITFPAKSEVLKKSFSNIPTVETDEVRNLSAVDVVTHKFIVMVQPMESIAFLGGKMAKK
jgi:large subunit ribosomal protein L4